MANKTKVFYGLIKYKKWKSLNGRNNTRQLLMESKATFLSPLF